MPRPTTGTRVEIRLPDETIEALDVRAETEGKRRADLLREIVVAGLDERRNTK